MRHRVAEVTSRVACESEVLILSADETEIAMLLESRNEALHLLTGAGKLLSFDESGQKQTRELVFPPTPLLSVEAACMWAALLRRLDEYGDIGAFKSVAKRLACFFTTDSATSCSPSFRTLTHF